MDLKGYGKMQIKVSVVFKFDIFSSFLVPELNRNSDLFKGLITMISFRAVILLQQSHLQPNTL